MGLASGFKKYLESSFQGQVNVYENNYNWKTDAIVVDGMCTLHAFTYNPDLGVNLMEQLIEYFHNCIKDHPVASVCFDQFSTTPTEKQHEWSKRPQPTERVNRDVFIQAVHKRSLNVDMFTNVMRDRELRDTLNTFIGLGLAHRANPNQKLYLMGHDEHTAFVHNDRITPRHDLTRRNLGEGDLSVIYAANILYRECDAPQVTIETIDTDVIAISMLHHFPGLYIHTRYKNTHHIFDIHALATAIPRALGYDAKTFVLLAISRGSDFNGQSIKGVGDWALYMTSARGGNPRELRQLLLAIIEKAPRKASMHPDADLKRVQWVFDYWRLTPQIETR